MELEGAILLGDLDREEVVFGDEARQTRQALPAAASDSDHHHVAARLLDDAVYPADVPACVLEEHEVHRQQLRLHVVVLERLVQSVLEGAQLGHLGGWGWGWAKAKAEVEVGRVASRKREGSTSSWLTVGIVASLGFGLTSSWPPVLLCCVNYYPNKRGTYYY